MCHVLFNSCGSLLNSAIVYDFDELFWFLSLVSLFFLALSFCFRSYSLHLVCVCVCWIWDYSNTLFQHGSSNISFHFLFFSLVELCKKIWHFKKLRFFVHDLIFLVWFWLTYYIIDLFCKWFSFFFLLIELISLMLFIFIN